MIQPHTETDPKTEKTEVRRGWARKHANRQINRIRHVFQWAESQEMIPATVRTAHQDGRAVEVGGAPQPEKQHR